MRQAVLDKETKLICNSVGARVSCRARAALYVTLMSPQAKVSHAVLTKIQYATKHSRRFNRTAIDRARKKYLAERDGERQQTTPHLVLLRDQHMQAPGQTCH